MIRKGSLLVLFFFFFILTQTSAAEYQFGVEISENFITQTHLLDRNENRFSYDETLNFLRVSPGLSFNSEDTVTGFLRADAIWEHYFKGDQTRGYISNNSDSDFDLELSDAFVGLKSNDFSAQLGFQPFEFGNGFIFSDNVPGATVQYENSRFYLDLAGMQVFDSSLMLGVTAGYRPGLFESFEAFAVWFEDEDDAFLETLLPVLSNYLTQAQVESLDQRKGHLYWFGISASKFLGNFYFNFTGAYELGEVEIGRQNGKFNQDISAYFFDAAVDTNLTDKISMGLFCFLASGDSQPQQGDFSVFLSPLPYNAHAFIFFDPNFMDRDIEESLIFGGVTPLGVISPGIHLTVAAAPDLLVKGSLAAFFAQDVPSDAERWYGWEMDLEIEYNYRKKYTFYVQAAWFEHGDFFKQLLDETPDPAFRLLVGGQFYFELK